jgi:hypothetical protein
MVYEVLGLINTNAYISQLGTDRGKSDQLPTSMINKQRQTTDALQTVTSYGIPTTTDTETQQLTVKLPSALNNHGNNYNYH